MTKRAAIYLRVSTDAQTTENQERRCVRLRRARVTRSWRCTGMMASRGPRAATSAPASTPCTRTPRAASLISSWPGRSIGSVAAFKT